MKMIQKRKKTREKYTTDKTMYFKYENELSALAMTEITFHELDIVTKGFLSMPIDDNNDFSIIKPAQKISKNKLTNSIQYRIMTGLMKSIEVKKFIEHQTILIPDFSEKLKAGFITKYNELKYQGFEGDKLFEHLHDFSSGNSTNYDLQTAGLAVLCYFFEICDVFEK